MAIQVNIGGLDKTRAVVRESLMIENILTRQVDRCKFSIRYFGSQDYTPTVGKEVTVYNGATKIFGGIIIKIDHRATAYKTIYLDVECEDYTRLLDRKLVADTYESMSVNDIIDSINTNYLSGFTLNNVNCSKVLNYVGFNYLPVAQALTELADLVQYDWYIDYDKDIHFFSKTDKTAPIDIQDDDGSYIFESLKIRRDNSQVRNVIFIRGGEYLGSTFTTELEADGVRNIYDIPYKYKDLSVTLTGQPLNVGLDYIDNEDSYDVLWNFQEKILRWRNERKPNSGATIRVGGRPYLPVRVKVRDKDSVDSISSAEGGSGEYEYLVIDSSINSREGARERATAELNSYKNTLSEGEFKTYESGLSAGQRIRINSNAHGIDEYFIINKVVAKMWTQDAFIYDVSLVTTKTFGIIEYLQKLLTDETKKLTIDADEVIDLVEAYDESITISEVVETSKSHNPQAESVTFSESFTAQSLDYDIQFVLGPYVWDGEGSGDTKRVFIVSNSYLG